MKLDVIDHQILRILQREARIANSELARRIGISAPATHERVRKLEKNGVIEGYVARVSPAAIGIGSHFFADVKLSPHTKQAVEEFIEAAREVDEIMECHHVTGVADFVLKVAVEDIAAYEQLILHGLTQLPHVSNLQTRVVLSTFKNETAYQIGEEHDDHS